MEKVIKVVGWPGLEYEPVDVIQSKHLARKLRTARKQMVRVFRERGFPEFSARLEALAANPRFSGAVKHAIFVEMQNDYIAEVNRRAAAATAVEAESPVSETTSDVGSPLEDVEVLDEFPGIDGNGSDTY